MGTNCLMRSKKGLRVYLSGRDSKGLKGNPEKTAEEKKEASSGG